ncbi:glycosyltransferase family 4 protein [Riemerella anatipestifer]|uniref:glycosyltransferase family 4 protein n=1 Tax=Riemerella anatipestifer TaxID=34085 RepID=UPI002A87216C|nr:glycosyltransferase family 1 protein [Riemerella anatipestifer]
MKNKTLIDLERLRYPNSGIANVFRNLANGIQEKSSEIDLKITYYGSEKHIPNNITNTIKWKKWHKFHEIFSQNFDVIHVSHQLSSYFHKNYKNAIKIVTLHDLNFLHENLSTKKREKMLRKVRKNLLNADYIVCISNFVKEDFIKHQHLFKLNKLKRIDVIHNGIELPKNRTYNLGRFQHLKHKKYLLNIGVLFDKKNQKALIEMLPYVDEDLVLVHSDEKEPYASELKNLVLNLNLENRVHFLKNVTEEEKYALLQNCSSYVHPSLAEGFGIPPIEAMSFGKPTFLSNSTSLPEIGGNLAYYFDDFQPNSMAKMYKKGMLEFLNSPQHSEKIKAWATKFDYKNMTQAYLKLYKETLSLKL